MLSQILARFLQSRATQRFIYSLLPLALVFVLGCIFHQEGAFFAWDTHRALLREVSVHGILACGMTLVILTGGIDLAVGSLLSLSAVAFTMLMFKLELAALQAVPLVLGLGMGVGAASGVLIALARIQPFIVTLAVMVFARGLAKELSDGKKVMLAYDAPAAHLPAIFEVLDARVLGGNLAAVTLIFVSCAVVTGFLLRKLRVGRYIYAVGGNAEAAELSGVPVRGTLIFAYAVSGCFAAIAGLCQAAQETHGDPETGMGYELDAIAMVVLGGTSLAGGRGGIGFTLIGALTLGYLQKILSLNAYSTQARLMLTGAILIGAVLFQRRGEARARA